MTAALSWAVLAALLLLPVAGRLRWVAIAVGAGALVVAPIWWLAERDASGAIHLAAAAVSGLAAWFANASTHRAIALLHAEHEALARQATMARVREDQVRIARELHDGIGAHLVALVWRAQRIGHRAGAGLEADMTRLQDTAMRALDDLRTTVWSLHGPRRAWPEVVEYVRSRLADRGRDVALVTPMPQGPDAGGAAREVPTAMVRELVRFLGDAPAGAQVALTLGTDVLHVALSAEGTTRELDLPLANEA